MLRKITQTVGRFKAGVECDYPRDIWNQIARDAGMPLDKFSEGLEANVVLQSALKGRAKIHRRLGATQ